jgi:hypothetical protein
MKTGASDLLITSHRNLHISMSLYFNITRVAAAAAISASENIAAFPISHRHFCARL